MSPAELGATLVEEVGNALSAAGALLLSRQDDGQFTVSHEHLSDGSSRGVLGRSVPGSAIRAALGDPPAPLLLVHARPVLPSRRERVPDRLLAFQRLHVSLVIPLQTRSGLEAVLCLRAKRTHEGYNAGDLALLAPVIRQAAAALDTSLLFARLEETVAELRAAYRRIASEQEAERARLAGELHDGIAQELANLITLATVAERQMEAGGEAAGATLAHLRDQAQTAYGEVRRVSHALRPVLLDDYGLASSLRRFAQTFQAASGIEVIVELAEVDGLSAEAELALFRVAQECLENARKHSGTRRAAIHLGREDGRIVLRVADEGRGVSADGSRGLGLVGMRERVEAVGGALRIESQEGRGASIEAAVPVEDV
jgi:signal transduction histidine kinase